MPADDGMPCGRAADLAGSVGGGLSGSQNKRSRTSLGSSGGLGHDTEVADDGILAGRSGEVRRALAHLQPIMPQLGLRFSMPEPVPAAGNRSSLDPTSFTCMGCTWNDSGNFEVLKSSIGSPAWCSEYSRKRADRAIRAVEAVGGLQHAHVGYYLLRASASACQLNYLPRTTPGELCAVR